MGLTKIVFIISVVLACLTFVGCVNIMTKDCQDDYDGDYVTFICERKTAMALLPISIVTVLLAGAIHECVDKELKELRDLIEEQKAEIQKLSFKMNRQKGDCAQHETTQR